MSPEDEKKLLKAIGELQDGSFTPRELKGLLRQVAFIDFVAWLVLIMVGASVVSLLIFRIIKDAI